ncbi:MAG: hypothetical protein HYR85_13035 [Planctomycetes bacterium]|nr:hypothetical protein [Planctomycetota bacterium]MBI3847901.1 hypothetical protein [Planctomycetota bacterium]
MRGSTDVSGFQNRCGAVSDTVIPSFIRRALVATFLIALVSGFVAHPAFADNASFDITTDAGTVIGQLVVCTGPRGITATITRPNGTVVCGPTDVTIGPGGRSAEFECLGHAFVIRIVNGVKRWSFGSRAGTLN